MRWDGVVRHEALIVSLVDHANPHLRAGALTTLLGWGRQPFIGLARDRLSRDESDWARLSAASALGYFGRDHPESKAAILQSLVAAVESDSDPMVQSGAYEAAVYVLSQEPQAEMGYVREDFDRDRDVDWALLAPYRGQAQSKLPTN